MSLDSRASEHWNLLGALVGIAGLVVISWDLQPWTLDDAYISFRYAENFAAGNGLVYNPGERVEGYTTFLWVFVLGIGNALGADTRTLAKGLGFLLASTTLVVTAYAHRFRPDLPRFAGGLAAAWLGTSTVFAAWAMPGMEVPLVGLLLLLCALSARSGHVLLGLVAALAMMARPDSVVVVGACLAWALAHRNWRPAALWGGLYLPYFLGRWWYYGWLLPNTFYAKVGATEAQLWRGVDYLTSFGWSSWLVLLPAVVAIRHRPLLIGAFLLHLAFVVSVGGDVMPAFRFISTVLPLVLIAGAAELARWPRWLPVFGVVGVVFHAWQYGHHPDLEQRIRRGVVGLRGEEVGVWLRDNVDPSLVLATNTAGSVPYFSGLTTIDMLGLNDAHIAHVEVPRMGRGRAGHEKADGAYVYARRPDIVHFGSARGRRSPVFRSDRQLFRQPGFEERYRPVSVKLPSGARAVFWVSRDAIASGRWPEQ